MHSDLWVDFIIYLTILLSSIRASKAWTFSRVSPISAEFFIDSIPTYKGVLIKFPWSGATLVND